MNIDLNNKKIEKIIYRVNNYSTLVFNFKDGELSSVTTNYSPKCKKNVDDNKHVLSDREMIEAVRKSEFMDKLNDAKNKLKKISNEFESKKEIEQPTNIKLSSKALEIAHKIIEMDKEGKLDELVKNHFDEIDEKLSPDFAKDEREMDINVCNKSIGKIEDEFLNTLRKSKNEDDETIINELKELLSSYKQYDAERSELENYMWNEKSE